MGQPDDFAIVLTRLRQLRDCAASAIISRKNPCYAKSQSR